MDVKVIDGEESVMGEKNYVRLTLPLWLKHEPTFMHMFWNITLCSYKLKTVFSFLLKVIAYIGGVLFLVFAAVTLFEIVR